MSADRSSTPTGSGGHRRNIGRRVSAGPRPTGCLVARRNLVTLTRVPTVFIFELVQPIMFVLLFRFIYANQLANLPPGLDYVQFLMPGIFIQNAIFGVDHHGDRPRRGPEDGHHRPVPVAADGAVGRARWARTTSDLVKNFLLVADRDRRSATWWGSGSRTDLLDAHRRRACWCSRSGSRSRGSRRASACR